MLKFTFNVKIVSDQLKFDYRMFRHMSDTKYFYTLKLVIALKCMKQNRQLTDMTGTKVILLKLL